jgi:hypothetical protein
MEKIKPDSLSLIFPGGYINNPASMFGHTLIRINGEGAKKNGATINSYIVNYGANTGGETSGIVFAFRGVFGLYNGFFSTMPYYKMTNIYNGLENRDIWEYDLKYSRADTIFYTKHIYELLVADVPYYFFKENCSYLVLDSLNIMMPDTDLTAEYHIYTAPTDTIRTLRRNNLIETANFRPSLQTQIRNNAGLFGKEELKFVKNGAGQGEEFSQLTYETAYKYLEYKKTEGDISPELYKKEAFLLLKEVRKASSNRQENVFSPSSLPDDGHSINRIRLAGGSDFLALTYKPAYHEIIDDNNGYDSQSQINFFSMEGRYYFDDKKFDLEYFDFVKIRSYSPIDYLFKPKSFDVKFSVKNQFDDYKMLNLEYHIGYTLGNKTVSAFILGGMVADYGNSDYLFGFSGVGGGILSTKYLKIIGDWTTNKFIDEKYNFNSVNVEGNIILDKNLYINGKYRRDLYKEFKNRDSFEVGIVVMY